MNHMKGSITPFFSIIIPALNEEKYLPLLLEDLSQQKYRNFEVIVVDGKSDDNTVKNSQKLQNKLPSLKIITSEIRNVSVQRNLGATSATGKYFIFNDADNRLGNDFLNILFHQLSLHPVDLFTTWSLPDTSKNSDIAIATFFNMIIEASQLAKLPSAFGSMIGCKKSVFSKDTGFNPQIGFAEDTEFVRRYFKKGFSFKVFHHPRYIYSLRRFHSHGTFNILQQYAKLNIKFLTNQSVDQQKEYPMGGSVFEMKEEIDVNEKINIFNKLITKPKIITKLKSIFTIETD